MVALEAQTGRTVILPVKVDDCEVPPLLADKRFANLHGNYRKGLEEIVLALHLTGSGSAPPLAVEEASSYEKTIEKPRASDCFVREPELENAISCVLHGHFAFVGERGAGKTDLLRRVAARVEGMQGAKAAFVDVSDVGVEGASELWRVIVRSAVGLDPGAI